MTFSGDLAAFADLVKKREREIFVQCGIEVKRSVVEGSELTGAPGQPVEWGNLKGSWVDEFVGEHEWQITTNAEYAPSIEDGIQPPYTRADGTRVTPGPMTLRSPVGGFHSVALTRVGWLRIVEHVTRKMGAVKVRHTLDTRRTS